MKKLTFFLVILGIGFGGGFFYQQLKEQRRSARKDRNYRIARAMHPILENKSFVILTMSYNNEAYCEKNLLSVLEQDYDNYRVIYIDDASTDRTGEKVQAFLAHHDPDHRVEYFRNETNHGQTENLYKAIHSCEDHEIVVIVDGDDFLAHPDVLSQMNAYYANPDVWLTYGDFIEYPSYHQGKDRQIGESRPLNLKVAEERGVRNCSFVTSHLRTFYAGLFKRIKLQDFLIDGEFLPMGCDVASMIPMMELAGDHAYFVPDLLYLYNVKNPLADHKKDRDKQFAVEKHVRNLPSYSRLSDRPVHDFVSDDEYIDIVVFSYNRPLQLYAFLESADKYLSHLHRMIVIYRSGNEHYEQGYQKVKEAFPEAVYLKQSESPYEDFAPLVRKAVFDREMSAARYIAFAVDDIVIKENLNLLEAAQHLKKTGAYGFYFRLGDQVDYSYMGDFHQGVPDRIEVTEGVYAWQFSQGKGDWSYPNTTDMTLYRKEDIYPYFLCMKFHNPNILEALWNEHADLSKVGLCYNHSKIVNLPLNIVMENEWVNERVSNVTTKDLLNLFDQGLKMDIAPLHEIENHSAHIEYEPSFIKR